MRRGPPKSKRTDTRCPYTTLYRSGVVQEHRVDRLAHDLVAAERERDVGDAAGDVAVGQGPADDLRRLDEVDRVVVVLLHAGGDGEDVGVEDDVLGREADLLGADLVGARAELDLAFAGIGLAMFVEGNMWIEHTFELPALMRNAYGACVMQIKQSESRRT